MFYLTSFARSVRESIFFAQISLVRRSVCTKTSGKYFPVQTSDSVNKPPERAFQQFHCFPSGPELAVPHRWEREF